MFIFPQNYSTIITLIYFSLKTLVLRKALRISINRSGIFLTIYLMVADYLAYLLISDYYRYQMQFRVIWFSYTGLFILVDIITTLIPYGITADLSRSGKRKSTIKIGNWGIFIIETIRLVLLVYLFILLIHSFTLPKTLFGVSR